MVNVRDGRVEAELPDKVRERAGGGDERGRGGGRFHAEESFSANSKVAAGRSPTPWGAHAAGVLFSAACRKLVPQTFSRRR
ncbi:hypothetical protein LBMAG56_28600 [Verrucomicrobiota bacterium]|nr:hypothetical protein LBMAG56_28600 [Verrucomicrobiota bacterium]